MIDFFNCTEEEMWQYVAAHLKKNHIETVLVGGAVVSIYSKGAYRSGDLDFVLTDLFVKNLAKIMREIGFLQNKSRHFIHPDCKHLFIDFVKGPVEIGEDSNITPNELIRDGVVIKVLSPTDCVKDRLASYIYYGSRECLDQAVLVTTQQPVDQKKVKTWCEKEGQIEVYEEYLKLVQP